MHIDSANATELATIAREVGAEVVEGDLRYQSGSWQLGDVDLGEYLDRYRDQRLMVVFVPLGEAEIADALDTLADIMVSDRMDELAGHQRP